MGETNNLLQKWEKQHWRSVILELRKAGVEISLGNIDRILLEMSFAVRSKKYSEKCPYYSMDPARPCHPILDLNCLLCACPNYNSRTLEGSCKIKSEKGRYTYHQNLPAGRVWDCSDCVIGHTAHFARKFLEENMGWLKSLNDGYEKEK